MMSFGPLFRTLVALSKGQKSIITVVLFKLTFSAYCVYDYHNSMKCTMINASEVHNANATLLCSSVVQWVQS